jgi:hypothetical protein
MKIIARIGLDLLKGAAAAAAALIGLVAGGMMTSLLGLPTPEAPPQADMVLLMPRLFLTLALLSIVLGECHQRWFTRYWHRFLAIWLSNYILYYLLNLLDALLFSPFPNMNTGFVSNLFPALAMAAVVALLWKPKTIASPDADGNRAYFGDRRPADWLWRFALAWLVYPPIYYLMGLVIAPFIKHYYEDPGLNLGLALPPSVGILLAMQVLRGALFLAAVLPLIVAWRGTKGTLWFWLSLVIFSQIAGQIILQAYWLPVGLRIIHVMELLVDSVLQAGVYVLLLSNGNAKEQRG